MASLPLLQSQIRRDPEGYEQEYRIQFRSFETTAQTFHVTPGRPHKHFQELVSFIAHVYPCYPKLREELNFPQIIFSTLRKEPERIHPSARKVMVAAVLSLLRREAVSLMTVMQELFKLFGIEDKELRSLLHGRLLSEISSRTTSVAGKKKKKVSGGSMTVAHIPPSELKKRLQEFFMKFINSGKSCQELVLRAVASLVCALYKRKDWVDEFTINSMLVTLCKADDAKVSSAAMHVFLGESSFAAAMLELGQDQSADSNKKNKSTVESDDETGGKKKMKKSDEMSGCDFGAIDMLMEPYSFTEDILKRAMNNTDRTSFEYRLLALRLVCRLVYRKELVVPNLYPFLEKYLYPSNRHVTKVLACLAQACHANVPPEEMQSVVRHVLNQFVSDHCRPEVITVGLNALRGICERAPLALTKDQLMDLVQYRHMKTSKSVSCAARALLNVYREVHPELLHKSVRGKAAAIAVHQGTTGRVRQFGDMADVAQDVEGIELLEAARKRQRRSEEEGEEEEYEEEGSDIDDEIEFDEEGSDVDEEEDNEGDEDEEEDDEEDEEEDEDDEDEEEDEDEESDSETHQSTSKSVPLAAERVLSNDDFKRIKKLRAVVAEKGSIDSDDLVSDNSDDEDEEIVEEDWILNPEKYGHIQGKKAADKHKAAEERKQAFLMSKETRRGGLTNKEKKRMKPLMMSVQKEVKKKRGMSAAQKFKQAKMHVSNLKKQVGPQKRRRSGKFRK